jgi:hypothetical protein
MGGEVAGDSIRCGGRLGGSNGGKRRRRVRVESSSGIIIVIIIVNVVVYETSTANARDIRTSLSRRQRWKRW